MTPGSLSTSFDAIQRARLDVLEALALEFPSIDPQRLADVMESQKTCIEFADLERRIVCITVIAPHAPGSLLAEEHRNLSIRRVRYAPERFERLAYGDGIVPNLKAEPMLGLAVPGLARAMRAAVREHADHADI
ncbi:MAG: hypothetical protein Q7V14_01975, partial [Coriobacteriia bacterium]|nr:hypothetical protein [Coriobacteriia bacterium]